MPIDASALDSLRGSTVRNSDGDKLGKVEEIYLDNESGNPEWAAVKTGMFGGHVSLVPLAETRFDGDTLVVPFAKAKLSDAPHHDPGRELSAEDETELYNYYGVTDPAGDQATTDHTNTDRTDTARTDTARTDTARTDRRDRAGEAGVQGRDTSGPTTDDAMTRSEERLTVGTQTREAGKARLRKHVTSHTETRTVPVSHEEVVVDREPITEANAGDAMSGKDLSEEEHEVTLHEQRATVDTETVPVERVRLGTKTVTGEQEVSAEVREEHVETDTGTDGRGRDDRDANR